MSTSEPEALLAFQLRAVKAPAPLREYCFARPRRWRFDFAWPDRKLAAEVEGGHWIQGRHTRGEGYEADCEKYAEAVTRGWRVLRVTPRQIKQGVALTWILANLGMEAGR